MDVCAISIDIVYNSNGGVMVIFDVQEAQKHLSTLVVRAINGEEVVITIAGKPVARLLPIIEDVDYPRVPGIDKGKVIIKSDFDEHLHEFEQ